MKNVFHKNILAFGPVPLTNQQYDSLLGHRSWNLHLLRQRTEWLAVDSSRRGDLIRHLISIQERLHLAV